MHDLDLITGDPSQIKEEVLAMVEEKIKEKIWPGDERYFFTMAIVDVLVHFARKANDESKQRMLAFARGKVLDEIGKRVRCERIGQSPAKTTIRFNAVAPKPARNLVIPAGTRVTADSVIYFATDSLAVLQTDQLYIDVPATCLMPGTSGNDYEAKDITTLVDLIPYIASVENLDKPSGGDDGEPYDADGDDHYRERIRLAPKAFSVAGPIGSYEYHAKSADASISNVKVISEAPGEVTIRPLLEEGKLPDDDLLEKVKEKLSAHDIRPMTDQVFAKQPEVITYDIKIHYYVTAETEGEVVEYVEASKGAIDQYISWQSGTLGRDVNPDKLRAFILAPKSGSGALRLDVVSPVYTVADENTIAHHSGVIEVTHEVVTE